MNTVVSHSALESLGWKKYSSDWYFYSEVGSTTHIHVGGSNKDNKIHVTFISLKLNDQYYGKIYNGDTGLSDWGLLEGPRIDSMVAIEFRRALKPFM